MPDAPPFRLGESRYDQGTFTGRLRQICAQLDPLKLLASAASLDAAQARVRHFKEHGEKPVGASDGDMWAAAELLSARTHPDTGERILLPLCFAAYCPMQPPIIIGMLWPGGGVVNQAFWQWYNASYNASVFYANKNASSPMTTADIAAAYCVAVTSSIGIGAGMVRAGDVLKARGGRLGAGVRTVAPFCGTVCGGIATLLCMRWNELSEGVIVRDPETGKECGHSRAAAREGIAQCCAARFIWNIPIFGLTPLITAPVRRLPVCTRLPAVGMLLEAICATLCVAIGIYPAQALFSQQATIPASRVEAEFRGAGPAAFVYNKGM